MADTGHSLPTTTAISVEREILLHRLLQRCMQAQDSTELGFVMVNDCWQLLPYAHCAFFQADVLDRPSLVTVSSLMPVQEDSPFTVWLTRVCTLALQTHKGADPVRLAGSMFDDSIASAWAEWWPPSAVLLPLQTGANERMGALLFVREEPWSEAELAELQRMAAPMAYCLHKVRRSGRTMAELWRGVRAHRHARKFLAAALLCLGLPVHLSILAPAEIIALNAQAVTAPMEGVVKSFAAAPNSEVKKGEVLFSLDDTTLRNRRDVALKAMGVNVADSLAAQQKAFDNNQVKAELGSLQGRVREKEAELAYLDETLTRVDVRAPMDGVFVLSDPNDWLGRPVVTGERIGQLAQSNDLGVLVWVPVGDAINLEADAPMSVYLQTAPLSSLSASLVQASYQAAPSPDGVASYRVRGKLQAGAEARIGLRGVAKIYGNWRPLLYWVLRRPLGMARQWLGL